MNENTSDNALNMKILIRQATVSDISELKELYRNTVLTIKIAFT